VACMAQTVSRRFQPEGADNRQHRPRVLLTSPTQADPGRFLW
jgi:hypothetical protein